MPKPLVLLAVAIAMISGTGAQAQGIFDLGPLSGSIRESGAVMAQPPSAEQTTRPQVTDFTFEVSAALRTENTRKFVDGISQQDPEAAKMLAGQDLIGVIEPAMQSVGLKTNDLADAYTMWLMSAYGLYRDIDDDATPRQVAGTRKMVATIFAGIPEFQNLSATDRQKTAEALILQALLNSWLSESLKQAPDRKPAFQQEFLRSAKEDMGIDLNRFDYGADGLYAKPQ